MPSLFYEQAKQSAGFRWIAGIDEAGRGPLAGPVSAAAVILPHDFCHELLDDSKKLSHKRREIIYDEISFPGVMFESKYRFTKKILFKLKTDCKFKMISTYK